MSVGSTSSLSAPSPQTVPDGGEWFFAAWADGGARVHLVTAGETDATLTATFSPGCGDGVRQPGVDCDDGDACTTDGCDPATGCTHAAVVCDDGESCTDDACEPATGACLLTARPEGASCDEETGRCVAGSCRPWLDGDTCYTALDLAADTLESENLASRSDPVVLTGCPALDDSWPGPGAWYRVSLGAGWPYELTASPAPDVDVRLLRLGSCGDVPSCSAAVDGGGLGAEETIAFAEGPARTVVVAVSAPVGGGGGR